MHVAACVRLVTKEIRAQVTPADRDYTHCCDTQERLKRQTSRRSRCRGYTGGDIMRELPASLHHGRLGRLCGRSCCWTLCSVVTLDSDIDFLFQMYLMRHQLGFFLTAKENPINHL